MSRLLLLLAVVLVAGCSPAPPANRSALVLAPCRLPGVEGDAQCGSLEVWENRTAASGRRISLNVAVIPARLRSHEPDPIVFFAGGPGQSAVALASQVLPIFTRLNDTRDLLLVDQRGTGQSNGLDCDDDEEQPLQSVFEDALPERLVRHCLEELDADPAQYATPEAVADMDEVRAALGYDKLNLWGGSYGTRVALDYLRRHGDHVRTMVLDGVAPSTMKLPLSFVADGEAALERLLADCDGQVLCRRSYPQLRETIARVRGELARRPLRVSIQDPRTGERDSIKVTENVFLAGLFRPLYVAELASLLPFGVASASRGDFNPLLAQNLEFTDDVSENLSLGMHLAVICSEDIPRVTREDLDAAGRSFFGRALVDDFLHACTQWPRAHLPDDFYQPVKSDVPALLLSGGIDPATPPRHAEEVARTLTHARHLIAPYLGHGVSLHGCAPRLIETFVRKGSVDGIDGKCLERIPRPLFLLPLGAPSSSGFRGPAR